MENNTNMNPLIALINPESQMDAAQLWQRRLNSVKKTQMDPTKLQEALDRLNFQGLQEQQKGIGQTEEQLNALRAAPVGMDISPLLTVTDAYTGSRFSQGYKRPNDNKAELAQLEKLLANQRSDLAKNETDILKAQLSSANSQRNYDLALKAMTNKQGNELSPGQTAMDRGFGTAMADFKTDKIAGVASNLAALDEVAGRLGQFNEKGKFVKKDDWISGGVVSSLPEAVRTRSNTVASDAEQILRSVIQQDLRLTLGAQFTEKEGEMMIKNAYDIRQDEQTNYERIQRLVQKVKAAAKAKEEAYKYFVNNNQSLKGYTGPSFENLVDDIKNEYGKSTGKKDASATDFETLSDEELTKLYNEKMGKKGAK